MKAQNQVQTQATRMNNILNHAMSMLLPVLAEGKVYRVISGQDDIRFVSEGLDKLESLGLSLAAVESTATPAPGFPYAWELEPPSLGTTNLTFVYDPQTNFYAPLTGPEKLLGKVIFDVDTSKLNLPCQIEFKDFIIDFDENLKFTVASGGLTLFDSTSSEFPAIDLKNHTWSIGGVEVFVSQELSDFLVAAGASQPTVGLKLAESQAERGFVEAAASDF